MALEQQMPMNFAEKAGEAVVDRTAELEEQEEQAGQQQAVVVVVVVEPLLAVLVV